MATVTDTGVYHHGTSTVQTVSRIAGIAFIAIALVGYVTGGLTWNADVDTAPRVFGLFPVNIVHNTVHLLLGIWALAASGTHAGARGYAKTAGVLYLVLAIVGVIAPNGFGLVPLGGNDIWLHVVLGVGLLAFGLAARDTSRPAAATTTAGRY